MLSSATVPVSQALEEERVIFTIRPTMLFVLLRYIAAGLVTIGIIIIAAIVHSRFDITIAPFIAFALSLLVFLHPVYHHLLWRREFYTLTNHKIEFSEGLLTKTTRNIPLTKIQDVMSTATLTERMLGIGDIIIDSASELGKVPLRNIKNPKMITDTILKELRHRE